MEPMKGGPQPQFPCNCRERCRDGIVDRFELLMATAAPQRLFMDRVEVLEISGMREEV